MRIFQTIKIFFNLINEKCFDLKYLRVGKIKRLNETLKKKITKLENSIEQIINNQKTKEILKNKEELFNKIFEKFNFKHYIKIFILETFKNEIRKKNENNSNHKNILLIGKPGIGKSTLINSFLKIDKAKTGIGKPITQDFDSYISNSDNSFKLFDSKGIENYENTNKELQNFINKKLLLNKNELINCIWYCFNGTRYNDEDKKLINYLLYKYENILPIIIIYTRTLDHDEADNYLILIKDFLGVDKDKCNYIKILAKDTFVGINRTKYEAFGLDELKKITLKRIEETYNSSYFQSLRETIIFLYKYNIKKKFKVIKEKVYYMIDLIQYNSIIFFNFENYFLEILNLIFFNDNVNHNIKDLLKENFFLNENNNLIDDEENILLNENVNQIPIYQSFLEKITKSYNDEFELKMKNIYDTIIENCFPNLSNKNKEIFLLSFIKEIRSYIMIDLDNNVYEEREFNMNELGNELSFEAINDINEDIINELNIEENQENDNNKQLNNIEINNINQNIDNKYKAKKYKIDNSDIIRLKFIEHQIIIKSMKYLTEEILIYIKNYMLSNEQIRELKTMINNDIIKKLKENN